MDVIGAGFGRTGTLSFKTALERLGFSPCYHIEDMMLPGHLDAWSQLADGGSVDWVELLRDFRATTDFPACLFYEQQAAAHPDAKVVLTVREADKWAASAQALRAFNLALRERPDMHGRTMTRWFETVDALVWHPLGDIDDTEHLMRFFEAHNAAVQRTIPAERLLVFDVRDGWAPLCDFLDVAIPDEPFPNVNERGALDDMLAADTDTLRQQLGGGHSSR